MLISFQWDSLQQKLATATLKNGISEGLAYNIIQAKWGKEAVASVEQHLACVPDTLPPNLRCKVAAQQSFLTENVFADIIKQITDFCPAKFATLLPKEENDCYILTPPVRHCLLCVTKTGQPYKLGVHNKPVSVKFVPISGPPTTKLKVCLGCPKCSLKYNYSQYGNKKEGFRFYREERPSIEASDVCYIRLTGLQPPVVL